MNRKRYDSQMMPKLFSEVLDPKNEDYESDFKMMMRTIVTEGNNLPQVERRDIQKKQNEANLSINEAIQDNFYLDRDQYKKLLRDYRKTGDVTYIHLNNKESNRNANVLFLGADFENFELKNLYKTMNFFKPEIILVQVRPDQILDNFRLDLKVAKQQTQSDQNSINSEAANTQTDKLNDSQQLYQAQEYELDERKYLAQIIRNGFEMYPNTKLIKRIQKILKSEGIIVSPVPMGQEQDQYKEKLSQVKQFEDYSEKYENTNRLTREVLGTAALWAEHHKAKICLADIPLTLQKYNTINSYPLLDLEEQYEKSLYYSYQKDENMYHSSLQICPDIMLGHSDEYMGALVNKLSEFYSNIMVLCGYGQSRSIPHYMYYSKRANVVGNNLDQIIRYKPVYENLVRKDNQEMTVDKLHILDSIFDNNLNGGSYDQAESLSNISQSSQYIIKNLISQQSIMNIQGVNYSKKVATANESWLFELYNKLKTQKYQEVIEKQRKLVAKELENKIKRLVRDDPSFIKELP
eukprot:403360714